MNQAHQGIDKRVDLFVKYCGNIPMTLEKQIIEASRTKIILLIAISLGCIAAGVWMLPLKPAEIESQRTFNSIILAYGIGVATVSFFGLGVVLGFWRLFSRKPALELSSDGITIFHIGANTFTPWSEVSGFSTCKIRRQKLLAVHLHDPRKYIEACGKFNSYTAKANNNLCGSPIVITANSLKISFEELCKLCEQYLYQYESLPNG